MSTQTEELRVITLRAPVTLTEELELLARSRDRSLSGEVRCALREHLAAAALEKDDRA